MTPRWSSKNGFSEQLENAKIDAFLAEVIGVCKAHGLSISHEDSQGAFIVRGYRETDGYWLSNAHDYTEPLDD